MRVLDELKRSQGEILAKGWKFVLYEIFNLFFNYPLYWYVMHYWGLILGWCIMVLLSFIQNASMFWYYDFAQDDWMFAKTAREWEEGTIQASSRFRRMLVKISRSRDDLTGIPMFLFASINVDPLVVAIHYQKCHFWGLGMRDWMILVSSVVIANLWWGFRMGVLVKVLEWLFRHS